MDYKDQMLERGWDILKLERNLKMGDCDDIVLIMREMASEILHVADTKAHKVPSNNQ